MTSRTTFRAYVILFSAWILVSLLALKYGSVSDASAELIIQLRLPRVILATAVGMGLAVAGATLQALFANPLCEPYTLGISSGSALGAVIGAAAGLGWTYAGLAGPGFLGGLLFAGVLYLISFRTKSNLTLLLAGVMLGFLGSSLVALWMSLSDASGIQGALFWLLGDLSRARFEGALIALVSVTFLSVILWSRWRDLDALLLGEEGALSLGVPVAAVRRRTVITVSLLIGFCVSTSGMIGFLGLVVPHLARRFVGSLHFALLPLCAIAGAATLVGADTLARVLASPYELPVGVVTALFGAPLFLWIMLKRVPA